MKRAYLSVLFVAVVSLLFAQSALAIVLNPNRPITSFGPSADPSGLDLNTILNASWSYGSQGRMNPWVGGPDVIVGAMPDQTNEATFIGGVAGNGSQTSTILAEIAGYAGTNELWVYDPNGGANFNKLRVFSGGEGQNTTKTISFTYSAGNPWTVTVGSNSTTFTNLPGNIVELGFALKVGSNWMYTEDWRNDWGGSANNQPQALVFRGKSTTSNPQWIDIDDDGSQDFLSPVEPLFKTNDIIVAFDDKRVGIDSDRDYQDFVFFVDFQEGTGAGIPEPASLLIWSVAGGAAAAGVALRRRKNTRTRWSDENRQAIVGLISSGRRR